MADTPQYSHTANISPEDIFARPIGLEDNKPLSGTLAGNASQTTPLVRGTVMGVVTATGEFAPYVAGASDGTETAVGILSKTFDASELYNVNSSNVKAAAENPATIYRAGTFFEAACPGIDAAGKVDLTDITFE